MVAGVWADRVSINQNLNHRACMLHFEERASLEGAAIRREGVEETADGGGWGQGMESL